MTTGVYLSGIDYATGQLVPLELLKGKEKIPRKLRADLRAKGLAHVSVDRRTIAELVLESVRRTLMRTSLQPGDIGAVVVANSTACWSDESERGLLLALNQAGFTKARIAGVNLQGCAVSESAIELAASMLRATPSRSVALLIIVGKAGEGSRLGYQNSTVYGDGAASAVVSLGSGEFEVVAMGNSTDAALAMKPGVAESSLNTLQAGLMHLRGLCSEVLRRAGMGPTEIDHVFGTNGSEAYLNMIAIATEIPPNRVYRDCLSRFGHIFACDNFIGMSHFAREGRLSAGTCHMLVSWAPHAVSACVLRYTALASHLNAAEVAPACR